MTSAVLSKPIAASGRDATARRLLTPVVRPRRGVRPGLEEPAWATAAPKEVYH